MDERKGTKRKAYTLEQKQEVIHFHKSQPLFSQRQLSKKFDMPLTVINKILNNPIINETQSNKNMKRIRTTFKTEKIDNKLLEWFTLKRRKHFTVTDDILKSMALKLAELYEIKSFTASSGWLSSFKKRHNMSSKTIIGEEGLVDQKKIDDFKDIISKKMIEYAPRDIYNCDETGLFYKCTPNRTLTIKNTDRASGRFSKERVTLLFCVNILGEKLKPLMVGSAKNPRGFKNINFTKLKLTYDYSKKAWMTLAIFCKWLHGFNESLIQEQRNILLILDNAPVHPVEIELSNIELLYLPPNTSSKIQALDQGIILSFKQHYKKILNRNLFFEHESTETTYESLVKKVNLLDAVHITLQAWDNISMDIIKNCFRKSIENANADFKNLTETSKITEDDYNDFPPYDQEEDDDENFIRKIQTELIEIVESENELIEETTIQNETIMTPYEAYLSILKLKDYFMNHFPENINMIYEVQDKLLQDRKSRNLTMLDFVTKI